MKELFKRTTTSIIISSIVAFIIGLIMVIWPGISLQTIGIIAGIYVIAHGVVLIGLSFGASVFYTPFSGVIIGVLSILVGLVLIAMPNILSTILVIALGIWVIVSSINILSAGLAIRNTVSSWYLLVILGIVDLSAGMLLLFNPFAASISIIVLAGIIIMIHSVVSIIDMIVVKKNIKDFTKAVEATVKTIKG